MPAAAGQQEVDLGAAIPGRGPIGAFLEQLEVVPGRPQQGGNPTLEQRSAFLRVQLSGASRHSPHHARIEPVELRVAPFPNPQAGFEGRHPKAEQRVLQDFQVPGQGGPADLGVPRGGRHADQLTVHGRGHRQEAGKAGQIAHQGFGLDLLF